ncbi:hypothetical protein [Mesonia aestuariivivens]|uniref:Uncharacterized protein n=1 Tax=Mesonia aestuariivivens TaxID=2796128 RepID=A0ABS6W5A3_9FLAO|nr:hypothetical protein [Mesonia aestuariivivens]MBW2962294.1 hypothetical protein [Mesonia aestuariivivens]
MSKKLNHIESQYHFKLRKRLMQWHRNKQKSIKIIELLDSNYQRFRNKVSKRLSDENIDFYDAIKKANVDELEILDMVILNEKLNY